MHSAGKPLASGHGNPARPSHCSPVSCDLGRTVIGKIRSPLGRVGAVAAPAVDDCGATMVEYGLLITLIAGIVATGAAILGTNVTALYTSVTGSF